MSVPSWDLVLTEYSLQFSTSQSFSNTAVITVAIGKILLGVGLSMHIERVWVRKDVLVPVCGLV